MLRLPQERDLLRQKMSSLELEHQDVKDVAVIQQSMLDLEVRQAAIQQSKLELKVKHLERLQMKYECMLWN